MLGILVGVVIGAGAIVGCIALSIWAPSRSTRRDESTWNNTNGNSSATPPLDGGGFGL